MLDDEAGLPAVTDPIGDPAGGARRGAGEECFTFGPFVLDSNRAQLSRAGVPVAIGLKPYSVLLHLLRQRERIVPTEELLELAWAGTTVSRAAFQSVIRDLRRLLGDSARESRFIETVRGRGLRFIHPVGTDRREPGATDRSTWEVATADLERALAALDSIRALRGDHAGRGARGRARSDLLLALGRARWAAGATDDSRETFLQAAQLAREANDPEILGWAALGFAGRTDLAPEVSPQAVALMEEALLEPGALPTTLRAELLARLGTELYFASDPARSEGLTEQAVALAEAGDDKGVLAYTLTAQQFVLYRPDIRAEERLPIAERAISLVADEPASDVLALALQERMVDLLEIGEGPAFGECLRHFGRVSDALQQPFFLWVRALFDGLAALLAGDIGGAESLAFRALEHGRLAGTPNAFPNHLAQLFAIRREQGRLAELVEPIEALLRERAEVSLLLAALANARAASGQLASARVPLERLAGNLATIPRDLHWLATLGAAAEAAAALDDSDLCEVLTGALEPYRGRMILVGYSAATHGAVDHHLGSLAIALDRSEAATGFLRTAQQLEERVGARLWVKRTRERLQALDAS